MTSREIAELYVAELTRHPARHGLELYLSKGYTFGRLPTGKPRGPRLATGPARAPAQLRRRGLVRRFANRLVGLKGARLVVENMRARGVSPAEVQRWCVTQTPYTLRQIFAACTDEFERRCYFA